MVLACRSRGLAQLSRRLYTTHQSPQETLENSALLPQSDCVLPRIDKWAFPASGSAKDGIRQWRYNSRFRNAVLEKNVGEAWNLFKKFPMVQEQFVRTMIWTGPQAFPRFLRLLQSEDGEFAKPWEQAQQIKMAIDTMRALGHVEFEFAADDYAQLIKLAGRASDFDGVQKLWAEAGELGITKNTNMWNQYLAVMCDADPNLWALQRKLHLSEKSDQVKEVTRGSLNVHAGNIVDLESQRIAEGVPANSRTAEVKMLAAARLGLVSDVQELIVDNWLHPDLEIDSTSPMAPTLSTLRSIVEALAFNNQLEVGFRAAEAVADRYKFVRLGSKDARKFWVRVLRLYRETTAPVGPIPSIRFGEVWNSMVEKYHFVPGAGPWSIQIEFLEWKNQFHEMEQSVQPILDSVAEPLNVVIASSALKRAVTGLGNTGKIEQSIELLQKWADKGLDLRRQMLPFVRSHAGDREKLGLDELQDEDEDDEESILGY